MFASSLLSPADGVSPTSESPSDPIVRSDVRSTGRAPLVALVALVENRRVTSPAIFHRRLAPVSVSAYHVTRRAVGTRATADNVSAILIDILIDQSPPPPASSCVISSS
jgi:hypothetical protein